MAGLVSHHGSIGHLIAPGMPHHVTQRGNRGQQTFFGEGDVGPTHLPGDERPRARDPHPDPIGAFGPLFYRWRRPAGIAPPGLLTD